MTTPSRLPETKVSAYGVATIVIGAIVQALADQGLTVEELISLAVTALAALPIAYFTRNRQVSQSTIDQVEGRG